MIAPHAAGSLKVRFEYWPVVWLWPFTLIFMQLTILRIADFDITLAFFAVHLIQLYIITFYWINYPSWRQVAGALVILLYTLTLGLSAHDGLEFLRSIANIANLLLTVVICLNARLARQEEIRRSLAVFCVLASAVALLIIAQALSFNLWRSQALAQVLGDLAPLGPGDEPYAPHPGSPVWRANGVFSEPSVAGWFMCFACALALAARRVYPVLGGTAAAVCAVGAASTLSLTGVFGIAIVIASYLLFVRDAVCCKITWSVLGAIGLALITYIGLELGIFARFQHLGTPGTSIYFRITAPLALLGDALQEFPFGHPVGQTDYIATRDYYVNWEEGSQTNIDNTLLMIVFYFGLAGLLANLTYLFKVLQVLVARRHVIGLVLLSLLIALNTTGAGWAHHFVLLIGYSIFVGRFLLSHPALAPKPRRVPQPASWVASLGGSGKGRLRLAPGGD